MIIEVIFKDGSIAELKNVEKFTVTAEDEHCPVTNCASDPETCKTCDTEYSNFKAAEEWNGLGGAMH